MSNDSHVHSQTMGKESAENEKNISSTAQDAADLQQALLSAKLLEQELQELQRLKSSDDEDAAPKVHRPISFGGMSSRKLTSQLSSAAICRVGSADSHRSTASATTDKKSENRSTTPKRSQQQQQKSQPSSPVKGSSKARNTATKQHNPTAATASVKTASKATTPAQVSVFPIAAVVRMQGQSDTASIADSKNSTSHVHPQINTMYNPDLYGDDDFEAGLEEKKTSNTTSDTAAASFSSSAQSSSQADELFEYLQDMDAGCVSLNTTMKSSAPLSLSPPRPFTGAAIAKTPASKTTAVDYDDDFEIPSSLHTAVRNFSPTAPPEATADTAPTSTSNFANATMLPQSDYDDDFEAPVVKEMKPLAAASGDSVKTDESGAFHALENDEFEDLKPQNVDQQQQQHDRKLSQRPTSALPRSRSKNSLEQPATAVATGVAAVLRPATAGQRQRSAATARENHNLIADSSESIKSDAIGAFFSTNHGSRDDFEDLELPNLKEDNQQQQHQQQQQKQYQPHKREQQASPTRKSLQRPMSALPGKSSSSGSIQQTSQTSLFRPTAAAVRPATAGSQHSLSQRNSRSSSSNKSDRSTRNRSSDNHSTSSSAGPLRRSASPIDRVSVASPTAATATANAASGSGGGCQSRELSPNPFRRRFMCINGENFKEPTRPSSAAASRLNSTSDSQQQQYQLQLQQQYSALMQRPQSAPDRMTAADGQQQQQLKPQRRPRVPDWKQSPQQKLEKINQQLAEIRLQRVALSRLGTSSTRGKRVDYSKSPKKAPFHHPQLDFVYGEIMNSPYLTNPIEYHYDQRVLEMDQKLKELRFHRGGVKFSQLPEKEKPYDVQQVKKSFIQTVAYYVKPPISPIKNNSKIVPDA